MNLYYERDNIKSINLEFEIMEHDGDIIFATVETKEGKWFRFTFDRKTDNIKIMFED